MQIAKVEKVAKIAKIVLIQAFSLEEGNPLRVYPLGIATLAAALRRRGHQLRLFDMNCVADPHGVADPYAALRQLLTEFQPDVIGVSLRNIDTLGNRSHSLIPSFIVTVRFLARLAPDVPIIAGGTGFTLFAERLMRELPEITCALAGEAERSLPDLLEHLARSGSTPLPDIPGLCRRAPDGSIIVAPPVCTLDLARDYIRPDRELLPLSNYMNATSYVPAIGVETRRGCPCRCAYCVYPQLQGRQTRGRLASDVVDEIETLHRQYGVTRFHFNDPVVNTGDGYLETLCEEMLTRGLSIKWGGFFREEWLNEGNAALFARSGCECFAFSPDGLTERALETLCKDMDIASIVRAAEVVARTDVIALYHFMVNVPGDSTDGGRGGRGLSDSKKLIDRLYAIHAAKRNLGAVVLNNLRIMPGTRLEALARAEGVIDENTDLLYPVYYNPPPLATLRYQLEAFQSEKNVLYWQGVI